MPAVRCARAVLTTLARAPPLRAHTPPGLGNLLRVCCVSQRGGRGAPAARQGAPDAGDGAAGPALVLAAPPGAAWLQD
eukprot:2554309-Prymnesium_polylepis.1